MHIDGSLGTAAWELTIISHIAKGERLFFHRPPSRTLPLEKTIHRERTFIHNITSFDEATGAGYLTRACLGKMWQHKGTGSSGKWYNIRRGGGTMKGQPHNWFILQLCSWSAWCWCGSSEYGALRLGLVKARGCQVLQDKLQHGVIMRTLKQNEHQYPSDIYEVSREFKSREWKWWHDRHENLISKQLFKE